MKFVSQILNSWFPMINPEQVVEGIISKAKWVPFQQPKKALEVECPVCHSKHGGWNLYDKGWYCSSDACIQGNKGYPGRPNPNYKPASGLLMPGKPVIESLACFGVPPAYELASIYECHLYENQKKILSAWANKPTLNLVLSGNAGRGKTYAACVAISEYRANKGDSARFVNVSELYLMWKDCARNYGDDLDLADKYRNVDLLVMDDLGTRTPTDPFLDFLYAIINLRLNAMRGTLFTTNMGGAQMLEKFGEALTSRICSGEIMKIEGKDKRLKLNF